MGLWCNRGKDAVDSCTAIASLWNGQFKDVFLPRSASKEQFDAIRATVRPTRDKLLAHLWTVPGSLGITEYVAQVNQDISRLAPGVVELNIEEGGVRGFGTVYSQYLQDVVKQLRALRPQAWFRINIAPYKAFALNWKRDFSDQSVLEMVINDPRLYVCEQTYYGDMSRVSEAEALADLASFGVPLNKASVCYGAQDERRDRLVLPTIFYNNKIVRHLQKGLVFSDDLLRELGLL